MADLPTADEAFGKSLPTADEAFPDHVPGFVEKVSDFLGRPQNQGPYSGSLSDYVFSKTGAGRILSAFGQGAKQEWGSAPSLLSSELDHEAQGKDAGIVKGFNEGIMRPLTAAVDFAYKAPFALGAGLAGATTQAGLELHNAASEKSPYNPLKYVEGAAGEAVGLMGAGAIPEGIHGPAEAPTNTPKVEPRFNDPVQTIQEARAHGVIGEGEAGYFGTVEPTPEDIEARTEAAKEAGLSKVPEPAKNAVPTIDELARQVDPDTFKQWDALSELKGNLQDSLQYVGGREGFDSKSASELRSRILDTDFKLRDLIPQTADARERVSSLLESDSKEGGMYRDYIQSQALEVAIRQQELSSDVQGAYAHADTLYPPKPEPAVSEAPRASEETSNEPGESPGTTNTPRPDDSGTGVSDRGPGDSGGQSGSSPNGPVEGNNGLTPLEGTGEEKVRGLAKRLLGDSDIEGPTYHVAENVRQMEGVASLILKDPNEAVKAAMGDSLPPDGILQNAVFKGVKKWAEDNGDLDLVYKLATESKLIGQATRLGQELQILRDDSGRVSATDLISDLQKAREGQLDLRQVNTIQNGIKSAIEKAKAEFKPDWESFTKSLECD